MEKFTVLNLHNWINVDEIKSLDLMGFYPMWTFHLWQHSYNSLSEGTIIAIIYTKNSPICSSDADIECNIVNTYEILYSTIKIPASTDSTHIFCPMVEFSWKRRSTSMSMLQVVIHHVIPPTTYNGSPYRHQ